MDRLKRLKKAMFVDGGLFFSVVLLTAVVFSWTAFVDWGGPVDDLAAEERARLEDCAAAERALGDSVLQERPDCKDVLPSSFAATVTAP
jgi:hypothetical protein